MKKRKVFRNLLIIVLLHIGIIKIQSQPDYGKLINAIAHVESKHNEKLVSKNHTHVGLLQISKITVDECNRIIGRKKYRYDDRFNREKSIEMFIVIQKFYNKTNNIERAIRLWNGGPNASKSKTEKYYRKVIKVYNRL